MTDRPLRVLHLHSGNMIGGIESVLMTLASCRDLCPEMEQHFALAFDGDFATMLRRTGAPVSLVPQVRLRYLPSVIASRHHFKLLLDDNPVDAVITHSSWTQLIYAGVIREKKIPLLFWMHGPFDGHWLQKLASFQVPDFVICNSAYTRSTLDRCYPRVRSRIIHYPVRVRGGMRDRQEVRAELGAADCDVVIVCAARMEEWKGHHNLIEAIAALRTQSAWRVWIAGAPNTPDEKSYFESLQRLAQERGVTDRIRFLGHRSDVPSLMAAADIHCQPNAAPEPFGVVFIEALQAGLPVVTFAAGGPREILDANSGVLISPGDQQRLTAALKKLIENPALRQKPGAAGPARARALTDPGTQMGKLRDAIQSVVHR